MKIGILTFHWATNYGAVLQAYALQTYLSNMGHEVEIINYRPWNHQKNLFKCFKTYRFYKIPERILEFLKEKRIEVFRQKYLHATVLYKSINDLKHVPPEFDAYITGSDQVWNPTFTTEGEGYPTTSYFLDFGDDNVIKIAYAVSFGCEEYPDQARIIAEKFSNKFRAVSVREKSGLEIAKAIGFKNAVQLPDPTLLLEKGYYLKLFDYTGPYKGYTCFVYMLHGELAETRSIISEFGSKYIIKYSSNESIENWIEDVYNSDFVITNSFHGMVFSLLFHKPFIVYISDSKSASMKDRFISILSDVGLTNRIVKASFNYDKNIATEQIDWNFVDERIAALKTNSKEFLERHLVK